MRKTPRQEVREIGKLYVAVDHDDSGDARRAFRKMAEVNAVLYDQIPVDVVWTEQDPYDDYHDMKDSVGREKRLMVFSGGEPHPYFSHEEEMHARAVHDWFGHLRLGVDFSAMGEFLKWFDNRHYYPEECHGYFFTEVVGQLGAIYYLDDGFEDDSFEQKAYDMPECAQRKVARSVERNYTTQEELEEFVSY